MRLGKLIEYLENTDPEIVVKHGFGRPHSYRGWYEDLAFEPAENVTVGEMLAHARSALNKEFIGRKGGEYLMDEHVRVWIDEKFKGSGETIGKTLLDYMTGAVT